MDILKDVEFNTYFSDSTFKINIFLVKYMVNTNAFMYKN